jgi:FkbM family methyltransferase
MFRHNIKGVRRLYKLLYGKFDITVANKFGVKMQLDPIEYIDSAIIKCGYFDEMVLESILENIKKGDVFWDVGANIGLHSLSLVRLKPDIECIAFEPFYKNFDKLINNIKLNKRSKINAYNFALDEDINLHSLYTSPFNHGRTGFNKIPKTQYTNSRILSISADQLVQEYKVKEPNIVKLDTEGNELAILRGMKNIISRTRLRAIIFETSSDLDDISELLYANNFTIKKIDNLNNYIATRF